MSIVIPRRLRAGADRSPGSLDEALVARRPTTRSLSRLGVGKTGNDIVIS